NAYAFLAALEKDAKERGQRRRRNEQLANALKEQGNEAFRAGDFALAIQRYSEGLHKLRDKQELYTNRAQVSGRAAATSGCFCAKIKPQNVLLLDARQCYEKMLQIDPQKENLEKRVRDEERAEREVQAGNFAALSIQELLQKINTPGQDILYYTGGIRKLAMLDSSAWPVGVYSSF
uniref:Uncharacterized protein n=1 Tax=Cyanoderma ruficeps TaxID=181631 RepID=A0A8C3NZ83_9PASS